MADPTGQEGPDLSTPEGQATYRAELGRVARGWRWTGLALVVLGAVLIVYDGEGWARLRARAEGQAGLALLAAGWACLITGIVKRTRYHARRTGQR